MNSDNGGALGNELLLSASQVYNWQHFKQTNVSRKQVSPNVLKGLSGEYKWNNQVDLSIRYEESNNLISLIFPNGDEYKLTPIVGDELDFIVSGFDTGGNRPSEIKSLLDRTTIRNGA